MQMKNTILLIQIFAAAFILPSSTSPERWKDQNQVQADAGGKIIQTKIDIGGYALFVNAAGEGGPTVVFEAGGANTSSIWERVQPEIAKMTRTFSYDRAGLGKSDKRNLPSTCLIQARELHALLRKTDVKAPYILVANSYGAFIAKLFANIYPNEVSGIVFVDGTHEKLIEFLTKNFSPEQLADFKKMSAANPDGNYDEMVISAEQVKEAGKKDELRKKPLIVLTADTRISAEQFANTPMSIAFSQWLDWQQDLVALSEKGRQYIILGSGHLIHYDKPQSVINAIKKMIEYDLRGRSSPSYKTAPIAPEKMRRFAGKYAYDADNLLTIKEEDGRLFADIPYLIQTEMVPISESEIVTKDMDVAATIIRLTESGIAIRNKYSGEEKMAIRVPDGK